MSVMARSALVRQMAFAPGAELVVGVRSRDELDPAADSMRTGGVMAMTDETLLGEAPGRNWDATIGMRLAAGDASALAEVYAQLAGYVFGLARRVIRDEHRAEDVLQDVFCQLWEEPSRFDPARGTLRSFLGVLAHRRAVDHVRRSEASKRRDGGFDADRERRLEFTDAVHADLDAERVRQAVWDLPEQHRAPVLLAYFGGRTFREVAEILHIPEGTAKSRIRAALERLARTLDAKVVRT